MLHYEHVSVLLQHWMHFLFALISARADPNMMIQDECWTPHRDLGHQGQRSHSGFLTAASGRRAFIFFDTLLPFLVETP